MGLTQGQTYNVKITKSVEGAASLFQFERRAGRRSSCACHATWSLSCVNERATLSEQIDRGGSRQTLTACRFFRRKAVYTRRCALL